MLAEHFVQFAVEFDRAREVGAERLLHDDARSFDQAGLTEQPDRRQRRVWRHAQVVQPAARLPESALGFLDGRLERGGSRGERHVGQVLCEGVPDRLLHLARCELRDRLVHFLTEARRIEIIQRHADDLAPRDEAGARQMEQTRQQFALGQVAGGAHQHHHLGIFGADPLSHLRHDQSFLQAKSWGSIPGDCCTNAGAPLLRPGACLAGFARRRAGTWRTMRA